MRLWSVALSEASLKSGDGLTRACEANKKSYFVVGVEWSMRVVMYGWVFLNDNNKIGSES